MVVKLTGQLIPDEDVVKELLADQKPGNWARVIDKLYARVILPPIYSKPIGRPPTEAEYWSPSYFNSPDWSPDISPPYKGSQDDDLSIETLKENPSISPPFIVPKDDMIRKPLEVPSISPPYTVPLDDINELSTNLVPTGSIFAVPKADDTSALTFIGDGDDNEEIAEKKIVTIKY
jgi:hypothetical protein